MRDTHFMVVNNGSQVVGRKEVAFEQDWVSRQRSVGILEISKYEVSCLRTFWDFGSL